MEDIIEDNQVENILESQGMIDGLIVKNSDDIRILKKTKEQNSLAIKHIEENIDMIDKEWKRTKNIVEGKANKDRNKSEVVQEGVISVKCNLCKETYSRIIDL